MSSKMMTPAPNQTYVRLEALCLVEAVWSGVVLPFSETATPATRGVAVASARVATAVAAGVAVVSSAVGEGEGVAICASLAGALVIPFSLAMASIEVAGRSPSSLDHDQPSTSPSC